MITHDAFPLGHYGQAILQRKVYIIAATQVTDVHGNTVNYNYDGSGRLTSITSNDGRTISLSYSGSSKLVSSVTANGRTWTYSYRTTTYEVPDWNPGGYNYNTPLTSKVLQTVTQPDAKSWSLNLDGMFAAPGVAKLCPKYTHYLNITHPYGTQGTFIIRDTKHRHVPNAFVSRSNRCPLPEAPPPQNGPPAFYSSVTTTAMSVTQKKLSSANIPTATWSYTYEQDDGASGSSLSDPTNWTKVQGPTSHTTYYHNWNTITLGGKMTKVETRSSASGSALQFTDNTYISENAVGGTFATTGTNGAGTTVPVRTTKTITTQSSNVFTKEASFNIDQNSSSYSYGNPIQTKSYSNASGSTTPRVTDTTYSHNDV